VRDDERSQQERLQRQELDRLSPPRHLDQPEDTYTTGVLTHTRHLLSLIAPGSTTGTAILKLLKTTA
jgi:hypothetical protein